VRARGHETDPSRGSTIVLGKRQLTEKKDCVNPISAARSQRGEGGGTVRILHRNEHVRDLRTLQQPGRDHGALFEGIFPSYDLTSRGEDLAGR